MFDAVAFRSRGFYDEAAGAARYGQKLAVASGCSVQVSFSGNGFALYQRQNCGSGAFSRSVSRPEDSGSAFAATRTFRRHPFRHIFDRGFRQPGTGDAGRRHGFRERAQLPHPWGKRLRGGLMKRVVRQGNDRGFTLVELIISMVVVSIALGGVLMVMNYTIWHSADPMLQHQAVAIAESYLEEVLLHAYSDPDGSGGESLRNLFDDVDDYDGLADTGCQGPERKRHLRPGELYGHRRCRRAPC